MIELSGNWRKGFACDVHTLDSRHLGVDEYGHERWDTTRSEMGEWVYRLKYRGDVSVIPRIVDRLEGFTGIEAMHALIPIPSSNRYRPVHVAYEIACELGRRRRVPVFADALTKLPGRELKHVDNPAERRALLKSRMRLNNRHDLSNKNILLIDDLYRSGATLSVATDLLYERAGVRAVYVLALTKTRSKR